MLSAILIYDMLRECEFLFSNECLLINKTCKASYLDMT